MTLDELNINDIAIIKSINCDSFLKNRFYSLGIVKGAKIEIEKITLARNTIEIKINKSSFALRASEAEKIEVEYER